MRTDDDVPVGPAKKTTGAGLGRCEIGFKALLSWRTGLESSLPHDRVSSGGDLSPLVPPESFSWANFICCRDVPTGREPIHPDKSVNNLFSLSSATLVSSCQRVVAKVHFTQSQIKCSLGIFNSTQRTSRSTSEGSRNDFPLITGLLADK